MATEHQSSILSLVVGMFNAAPGKTYLDEFASSLSSGASVSALANSLAQTGAFQSIYADSLTANEFSSQYLTTLLGTSASDADKKWAISWMTNLIDLGTSRADAMLQAINALSSIPTTHPQWGAAASLLATKVAAAETYSITEAKSAASLEALQNVVSGITEGTASTNTDKNASETNTGTEEASTTSSLTGTWFAKEVKGEELGIHEITFNADGSYLSKDYGNQLDPGEINGTETGTYTWDEKTSQLDVQVIQDNNGQLGLFPNTGILAAVSGDQISITEGNETFLYSALDTTSGSSAVVGTWHNEHTDEHGLNTADLTLFANGTYSITENPAILLPGDSQGTETGTYSWNNQSELMSLAATNDGNGNLSFNADTMAHVQIVGANLVMDFGGSTVWTPVV